MKIGVDTGFLVAISFLEHPAHSAARTFAQEAAATRRQFALCPQVISEYLHVATDARRFEKPLSIERARSYAEYFWHAKEVVLVFPSKHSVTQAIAWMREHRLGRKRILDTQLAATYFTSGVDTIVTTDFRDFKIFDKLTTNTIS